jgi:DUF4097 and DUF4098 domain-containing protein YvlB
MKPLLSLKEVFVVIFLLLAHQFAWAADSRITVNETRQVSANERIYIEVMSGEVNIRVGTGNSFSVTGVLDEQAEGFELTSANGFTRFEVEMPRNTRFPGFRNNRAPSNLEFVVPLNSTVEFSGVNASVDIAGIQGGSTISTVNGPITASGLSNHVELKTVNGGIESRNLSGRIEITTVNGSIDDSGSTGRARYQAVNGRINVGSSADEISLSVVNGRVAARLQQTSILELNSVNGGIELTLTDSLTPRITGNSVSGNITLNLDPAINARFSVRNNVGGGISNRLSSDEPVRASYGPARRLEFSTGDGTGVVELTTLSGRVELNRN